MMPSPVNTPLLPLTASGTASGSFNNVNITTQNGVGVSLGTSSTGTIIGGTITTTIGGGGVDVATLSSVTLQDTVINSYGIGISLSATSTGTLNNVNITTQNGVGVSVAASFATITGGTIKTTSGGGGVSVGTNSSVILQDTTIDSFAQGLSLSSTSSGSLNGVNITTRNTNAYGVNLTLSSTLTMVGGSITTTGTTGAHGIVAANASQVNLQNTVINSYNNGINLSGTSVLAPYHANITTQNGSGV
jgi:hypothetical protein